MRLHLIGIFHTIHDQEHSHCAFTGKALRFPKMLQGEGHEVVEYSNEGSESTAHEKVEILSKKEISSMGDPEFWGDLATLGSDAHRRFERRLIGELGRRLEPGDIICHPFGHAHERVKDDFNEFDHVETGIGYPTLMEGSYRVFESYAWMHYHQGKEGRNGINYEWVIPNYFELSEWEPRYERGEYIAFMGRICDMKGMSTIVELAGRVEMPIKVAGQGWDDKWSHPNIEYVGSLKGGERSEFIKNAYCQLMPTVFTEPFGGSGVEGLLCGTPLIASDFGAFTETVEHGVNGYRCKLLKDWTRAIKEVGTLDRKKIAEGARGRYSLEECGKKYDVVFKSVAGVRGGDGWYG